MHWIVNTSLKREGGYDFLIDQLDRQQTPYTLVRKPPFAPYLVGMDDDVPMMLDHIEGPVFVTGTTSMGEVSLAHGWNPGYITAPSFTECLEHWGDHMLNAKSVVGELGKVEIPDVPFFVRPEQDTKSFAGTIMDPEEFEEFRARISDIDGWTNCPLDTLVQVAPLQTIWAEYRCYIIDGLYVTGSRYKTGQTVAYSADVGQRIIDYANARIHEWNPRIAVVLDIADTPDGLKVIETNAISSSGFYAIDMNLFVGHINALEDRGDYEPRQRYA